MENGTYGICEECGGPSAEATRVRPIAIYCVPVRRNWKKSNDQPLRTMLVTLLLILILIAITLSAVILINPVDINSIFLGRRIHRPVHPDDLLLCPWVLLVFLST